MNKDSAIFTCSLHKINQALWLYKLGMDAVLHEFYLWKEDGFYDWKGLTEMGHEPRFQTLFQAIGNCLETTIKNEAN